MAKPTAEEQKLVELAASCDDEAFCTLRDRYQQHLRVLVARYTPSSADREDLYAEIIGRLLADRKKVLREWKPIAPFAAYLTTIAVRHCLSWLDRVSRRPHTVRLSANADDAEEHELLQALISGDESEQPEQMIARRERRDFMHQALMQLSDSDRLVLALRFEQSMSGPEIGRSLGISPGAARQRIFKALQRLGGVLGDHDPGGISDPPR